MKATDVKNNFFRTIVKIGVNLFGGNSTKQIYNAALDGKLEERIESTPEEDIYGLSKGMKEESINTKLIIDNEQKSMIDVIENQLTENQGIVNKNYNARTGQSGLSDMGTVIGGHTVKVWTDDNENNNNSIIVHLYVHDSFDFEKRKDRNLIGEILTTVGRKANLPKTDINVWYDLKFRYSYEENGMKEYYYVE